MKVLVACEYSGIVREAFRLAGHDAISCDLLPTDIPGKHYQGDVMDIINDGFDLLIAHPPCQYLSYAAMKYWNNPGRAEHREKALTFFMQLYNAPIKHICIENPTGYAMKFIPYSQLINPFNFGDNERKRICLWLKNLPPLIYTSYTYVKPIYIDLSGKKRYMTDALPGTSPNTKKLRSKFFPGIAQAMSNQWSNLL